MTELEKPDPNNPISKGMEQFKSEEWGRVAYRAWCEATQRINAPTQIRLIGFDDLEANERYKWCAVGEDVAKHIVLTHVHHEHVMTIEDPNSPKDEGVAREVCDPVEQPPQPRKKGWGWPAASKKAHYFVDGRSLCLKWLFGGHLEDNSHESDDNCVECKRRYAKTYGGQRVQHRTNEG